jgi:cobyrinic acid a,c-diamide synthase
MYPRLVIAALRGASGKTLFSMGLCALWREHGKNIFPFKKGPDYIDAAWLEKAAGNPCHHLDPYLMSRDQILGSYYRHSRKADGSIIEGNRGLYDGVDVMGAFSTAEVAKLLQAPVVVVLDATKTTRTAAAMILGLKHLDPEVDIQGVVLNLVAGSRHESILRRSIEEYAGVKVFGALPRSEEIHFPERHLGLVPPEEHGQQEQVIGKTLSLIQRNVDCDALWGIAKDANELPSIRLYKSKNRMDDASPGLRIGVIRDEAFHFYYPENLEALEDRGAKITTFSALKAGDLPQIDALYIGGGFPEVYAEPLSDNVSLRRQILRAIEAGLPVYAECGGLMYLGETLRVEGRNYAMVGALPIETEFKRRPQGHGYTALETVNENPFFPIGAVLRGHEFHYSRITSLDDSKVSFAFQVQRGNGIDGRWEGIVRRSVLATYTHLHALGCAQWADGLVSAASHTRRDPQLDLAI